MHAAAAFPFGGSECERVFQRPTPAQTGNTDMDGCNDDSRQGTVLNNPQIWPPGLTETQLWIKKSLKHKYK